jgi:hypothetical protein
MINKNDEILLFLGRIQARIEDLSQWAIEKKSPLFTLLTEFESYFNQSINEIFSESSNYRHDVQEWIKGIKWNSLPR